jgi:hypothetical protein
MKKEKVLRSAGVIAIMFVLLACSVFSQVAPKVATPLPIAATVTVELPASTATATSVPATQEPAVVIRLGPGKFAEPIWLEVINGDYKLTSGTTLRAGSAVGVYTESLTFPTGLVIEIGEGGLVLMGVSYDAGARLTVDAAGNLVAETGTGSGAVVEPTASSGKILFQDDFSSNSKGWDVGIQSDEYGNLNRAITDGQYVMTMTGKQEYYFAINSIPDFSARDFVLSMDVTILESTVGAGNMSLEFSVRETDGVNGRHYAFSLFNDGTSSGDVWPTKNYQDVVALWSHETNSAIALKKGVTNTISLKANGSTFTLYVNGKMIKEVSDTTINETGNISFNLGLDKPNETLTIAFDNLTITAIP